MNRLANVHPGEILKEEFLVPLGLSAYRLAKETNMPLTRIVDIVNQKRRITADTALRLSKYFGNSAEFWLGIQLEYDLREEREAIKADLKKIHVFRQSVAHV